MLGALLGITAVAVQPAGAQSDPPPDETTPSGAAFSVQPSGPDGPGGRDWFIYTLSPGQVYGDVVAISNVSDRPIRFLIYAKDATNVPNVGGFQVQRDDEEPTDVGSWITLGATEYTVEPGMRIDVPFSVTIPDDAEPGDHAGAIVATDADAAAQPGGDDGVSFNVRERVGARVYVRVSGPVSPAMRVDRFEVEHSQASMPLVSGGGTADIDWEVRNTGNVRLTPTVQIRVKGFLGRTVATLPAQELPELLPGGTFESQARVDGLPTFERLTFEINVVAEGVDVTRATSVWSLHWAVFAALGVVLVIATAWWLVRRRRRRPPEPPPRPPARERTPVTA